MNSQDKNKKLPNKLSKNRDDKKDNQQKNLLSFKSMTMKEDWHLKRY